MVGKEFTQAVDAAEEARRQELQNLPPEGHRQIDNINGEAQRHKEALHFQFRQTERDDVIKLMHRKLLDQYNLEGPALLKHPRIRAEQQRAIAAIPDHYDRKETPETKIFNGRLVMAETAARRTLTHDRDAALHAIDTAAREKQDAVLEANRAGKLNTLPNRQHEQPDSIDRQAERDREEVFRRIEEARSRKADLELTRKFGDRSR